MTFNIIDIIAAVLILVFAAKNLGGPVRIIKSILIIVLALVVFGIVARLFMEAPLPQPAGKTLKESYFVNTSIRIIQLIYPSIQKSAPQVDSFIKAKIISLPTPEVAAPKIVIPDKIQIPREVTLPKLPGGK